MAQDIKSLQELIERKALESFNKDFSAMCTAVRNSPFANSESTIRICLKDVPNSDASLYFFFTSNNEFYKKLKEYWLPIYVSKEAEVFVKKVDDLQERVTDLLNYQPEQY